MIGEGECKLLNGLDKKSIIGTASGRSADGLFVVDGMVIPPEGNVTYVRRTFKNNMKENNSL